MSNRKFKEHIRRSLRQEGDSYANPAKQEETIRECIQMVREQKMQTQEVRTGFLRYLSDVFRFEGIPVLGLQAVTLLSVCLMISAAEDMFRYIPVFMPLFVVAAMPFLFRGQYYGMSEIEAVTRASSAQLLLAKLILAGAANLVCMTVLISLEVHLQNSYRETGQIIIYCLVPYLVCMVGMLRMLRLRRKESIQIGTVMMLGSCAGWGVLAKYLLWLYEASAFGIWVVAFLFFAAFFIKEIYFILTAGKEGKIYGIIV